MWRCRESGVDGFRVTLSGQTKAGSRPEPSGHSLCALRFKQAEAPAPAAGVGSAAARHPDERPGRLHRAVFTFGFFPSPRSISRVTFTFGFFPSPWGISRNTFTFGFFPSPGGISRNTFESSRAVLRRWEPSRRGGAAVVARTLNHLGMRRRPPPPLALGAWRAWPSRRTFLVLSPLSQCPMAAVREIDKIICATRPLLTKLLLGLRPVA